MGQVHPNKLAVPLRKSQVPKPPSSCSCIHSSKKSQHAIFHMDHPKHLWLLFRPPNNFFLVMLVRDSGSLL